MRASHVSCICRIQRRCSPQSQLGYRLTVVFRGSRFQRPSLTHCVASTNMARDSLPRLCNTYPNAASAVAITGLSYTAICKGCPLQYRTLQISPQVPDASRRPQQPTSRGWVVPFRAPPSRDFHPFIHNRVRHVAMPPVSVSPNPRLFPGLGLGRRGELHPSAPCVCRTSSITSMRLRR